jgi:siderophore synthetase component
VASGPTAGGRRAGHTSDAAGPRLDADVHDRFADELAGSVHGVALARAAAQPVPRTLIDLSGDPRSLAILEQSVVDGHPLHPLCRTRTGLGDDEIRAYAPEHHPRVDLEIYDVPADRWHTTGTGLPPRLLVHPWQRDHVLDRYPFLRRTGRTVPARPLMSLRTLALDREPGVHVKTAVDVQMTSAVRTVSAAAVHNGPVMSALLARLGLAVLTEEAAGAVLVDGEPERRLAMVRRRVPTLRPGEVALPFAVLSAPGPGGHPRVRELGDDPGATIAALARVTLPPLLRLLHQGIALEAHGQNLLLAVAGGRPTRVLYRDMGGVRVHPGRLRRAGIDPPELRGDIVTDDEDTLRTKLVAATVSTVFAELVATLRDTYGADPADLWRRVADAVRATYRDLPADAAGDEAAILGGSVPLKAMTAMRLSDTPLEDIWTPIANPMAR